MPALHANSERLPVDVVVDDATLRVVFSDGTQAVGPLSYSKRLLGGTLLQRQNWRWIGPRDGIHWPEVDEDLSVSGIVRDFGLTALPLNNV